MKYPSIGALGAALILALSPLTVSAATGSAAGKSVAVQFARGSISAGYRGQIRGLAVDRYRFTARQGQVLNVDSNGSDNNVVTMLNYLGRGVNNDELSTDNQVLPASGRYEVRVMQTRNGARQGNAPRPYQIRIQITNNGQTAAPTAKPVPAAQTEAVQSGNEIRFARGADSAVVSGKLRGLTVQTYRITARQGQVLNIDDAGSNPNIATMLNYTGTGVDNDTLTTVDQVLPKSGTYEIRVMQTRNGARKGKQWRPYRLKVSIR